METRARSSLAVGLGLVFWMFLLFSPLAWVGQAKADDTDNYGTVIGIVSAPPSQLHHPPGQVASGAHLPLGHHQQQTLDSY